MARGQGTVDYTDANPLKGKLTTTLTSVNPYMGWQTPGGMSLWAAAGYGIGEVEIEDTSGTEASDLTQQMFAVGANGPLVSSDRAILGGTTRLTLKGEAAFTRAEIEGSETLRNTSLSANRQRLTLEGSHAHKLSSGATLATSIEIGMRSDSGDGETGNGMEVGGGLRYADASSGLTIEGRVRTLPVHSGDYEEWGVSGLVSVDPGPAGRGLSVSLRPAWGQTASGVRRLWQSDIPWGASRAYRAAGRMDAKIGYGFAAAPGFGVVTPYAGLGLAGEGAQSWRAGVRWQMAPDAKLSLEGTRREVAHAERTEYGLMLRGALHW